MPGRIVRGYHGTTLDVAESVAGGDTALWLSANGYDWLGTGAYFWQDAPDRARQWARKRHASKRAPIAILSADIELSGCLDFCDSVAFRELKAAYDLFQKLAGGPTVTQDGLVVLGGRVMTTREHESNPTKRPKFLNYKDRAIIDFYVKLSSEGEFPIRSVRAPFLEGAALFEESFLFDWAHVQISVVDRTVLSNWSVEPI